MEVRQILFTACLAIRKGAMFSPGNAAIKNRLANPVLTRHFPDAADLACSSMRRSLRIK